MIDDDSYPSQLNFKWLSFSIQHFVALKILNWEEINGTENTQTEKVLVCSDLKCDLLTN